MQELPKRSDLPVEQTWDLTPLYKTGAAWEKDFKKLRALVRDFNQYKGKLSDPQMLYEAFRASDKLSLLPWKNFIHLPISVLMKTLEIQKTGQEWTGSVHFPPKSAEKLPGLNRNFPHFRKNSSKLF